MLRYVAHDFAFLDCVFESICERCSYFATAIEFRPTRPSNDARRKDQTGKHPSTLGGGSDALLLRDVRASLKCSQRGKLQRSHGMRDWQTRWEALTIARFELTEAELAQARSYAATESWDLPGVLIETASLLRRQRGGKLVLVTAPSIAPDVELVVPEEWFHTYAAGPPRSVRVLLVASVIAMWAAFRFQAEDPMNTTGQVLDMALDLLAGNAFADMIKMLRQQNSDQDNGTPGSEEGDEA